MLSMLLTFNTLQAEEKRLALVIGNGDYEETPLKNPTNDANDMAEVLESLGFEVILRNNATRREMARAIRDFGRQLKEQRGVGLFYYAGHGLQIADSNYLIPIGTPMEAEDEIPYESIDVGSVLAKMESAGNALNLMILDACRNNPFPSQFRSTTRGLARVEAPIGSLVVYSTAPGEVAADGDGRNGVFTGQLLKQLKTPGLSLTQTIRRTRAAVVSQTSGRQVPWASSSMLKDYYFSPEVEAEGETITATPDATKFELNFWKIVKEGNTKQDFEAYLDRYPGGLFSDLARFNISKFDLADKVAEEAEQLAADKATQAAEQLAADKATQAAEQLAADKAAQAAEQLAADKAAQEAAQLASLSTNDTDKAFVEIKPNSSQLTVSVTPKNARIRIMNIVEKYTPGMTLDRSRSYDVYVTSPGYDSYRDNITLDQDQQTLAIILNKRDSSTPIAAPVAAVPATVTVAGGSFNMGCSKGDTLCKSYEKPSHSVTVGSFAMTKTEITVSQFSAFVDATAYVTDAEKNAGGNKGCFVWSNSGGISRSTARWDWKANTSWRNPGYKQKGDFPVTCVSWSDAVAYADWLSEKTNKRFSLPTEAQWEFAARAGSTDRYLTSNKSSSLCNHANVADRSPSPSGSKWTKRVACTDNYWFSAPVSSFEPNGAGLYDMQGNVWEWVDDVWASSFKNTPSNGQANKDGDSKSRVLRGGAWDGDANLVRISNRSKATINNRAAMTGFRLVVR